MIKLESGYHRYRPQSALLVRGEDSFSFLQGQFTQDLKGAAGFARYGLWLSEKGKVVADSVVLREGESQFRVLSVWSHAAVLVARFEAYIVADDVTVTDETDTTFGMLAWGPSLMRWVEEFLERSLPADAFLERQGVRIVAAQRLGGAGVEFTGTQAAIAAIADELARNGVLEVDAMEAERQRLAAGVPAIPEELGPTDLPNEAGLEDTAISFKKGCYLGQEVMARLKNLGRVRRQLRRVRGIGPVPQRGMILFQGDVKVGEIRSAIPTPDGFVGMAMMTRSGIDEASGFTFSSAGATAPSTVWTS